MKSLLTAIIILLAMQSFGCEMVISAKPEWMGDNPATWTAKQLEESNKMKTMGRRIVYITSNGHKWGAKYDEGYEIIKLEKVSVRSFLDNCEPQYDTVTVQIEKILPEDKTEIYEVEEYLVRESLLDSLINGWVPEKFEDKP